MESIAIEMFHADDSKQLIELPSFSGLKLHHKGPSFSFGPKPAVFYFTLSANDSLHVAPYNQLTEDLIKLDIHVFSFTLPAHGLGSDNNHAMAQWANLMTSTAQFEDFFSAAKDAIDYLIDKQMIDNKKIATAGLSRGAFVATHLAALHDNITTVLGYSPLTSFNALQDFQNVDKEILSRWNLLSLIPKLIKKNIRFYIGNRDSRVGTRECTNFIQDLSEYTYLNGVRSPQAELTLFPSVGHKGHGTPPEIFQEGSIWLYKKLL